MTTIKELRHRIVEAQLHRADARKDLVFASDSHTEQQATEAIAYFDREIHDCTRQIFEIQEQQGD